ncbi:snf2 family helicase [Grosmannia clavigera kw1407]|uniref:Snf2 family helicase n=1 Tax=Grosmannia clavigera (strain kw1407 / UAMH 11150) TaxID=655863 RepID=F0XPU0_GROCL|nr:snf2 family helicase [Grosmannia clavigera kw1407]EFX00734.1 snf2 family helicase [Grosmannia clavigera kw1407]
MAESSESSDPFKWSTERLIQELYLLKRSRDARPANKWPDLDSLAGILREHELDGYDLLTSDDLGGDYPFDSLCKDLKINKIPHKNTLRYILKLFKEISPAYQDWKTTETERHNHVSLLDAQSRHGTEEAEPSHSPGGDAGDAMNLEETETVSEHPLQPAAESLADMQKDDNSLATATADGLSDPGDLALTSKKRKRVAPVNISGLSDPRATMRFFRAQADIETDATREKLWQASVPGAYLGNWKLLQEVLLQTQDPLSQTNAVLEISDFSWAVPKPIPAGRRLQVERILRRYFKPQRSKMNLGRRQIPSPGTDTVVQEEDDVLPLLGDSDEDEEYDSETWAEMEQEARERANPQPKKDASLSGEAVDAVINEAIRDMEIKWAQKKLPRLQRDMHTLWTDARRSGSLKSNVTGELAVAERLGRRIANITKAIRSDEWRSEAQIQRQLGVLEASVEDRERALWRAKVFASPNQPAKPTITRTSAPRTQQRAIRVLVVDDGDEVLTSASEEEDDVHDFIVDDDDPPDDSHGVPPLGDPMLVDIDVPVTEGDAHDSDGAGDAGNDESNNKQDLAVASPRSTASTLSTGLEDGEKLPLDDLEAIVQKGVGYWEKCGDVQRLLCTLLSEYDVAPLQQLFDLMGQDENMIWNTLCVPAMRRTILRGEGVEETSEGTLSDVAGAFIRLFDIFITRHSIGAREFFPLSDETRNRLETNRGRIGEFCVKLRILQPYFDSLLRAKSSVPPRATDNGAQVNGPEFIKVESESVEEEEDDDDKDVRPSPSYRRRRQIRTDKEAQSLREKDRARAEALDRRRQANRNNLVLSGTIDRDKTRLIINDAREDNQSVIYVNPEIGLRIRDHQIAGVRFMWNQLLIPSEMRQGCLLAHTMGLGKTMQVITLLVAISESAISPDENIVAQIPVDLRESKTLILCPSGLVENWLDEISCWTPPGLLGVCYPLTSELSSEERYTTVKRWADNGGVMIIGYPMLRKLLEFFGDEMKSLLEDSPHIVVADEAHALKNPKSKLHEATANFKTTARIAMTGSPLANSVEEYHSMINWVAPNYLADHREFAAKYATPIKEGFYRDSTKQQKRQALMRLKVLKDTVAPKIHRATVATLKGELPQKKEFILYLPLTELQMQVYERFIDIVNDPGILSDINNTVQLWNLLFNLTLLLAHPKVFKLRLEEMKSHIREGQRERDAHHPSSASPYSATLPLAVVQKLLSIGQKRNIDDLHHSSKVMVLMGILDEAREAGDKVLIFSQSKLVLDYLEDVFQRKKRRYSRLDGDTVVRWRQGMVKSFNAGRDEIYLISTTAGGVGLNIHGANRVVIFDFKWNPMHEQQAIGRAYRIGQTKPVFVYWLITGGTFETVLHDQAVFKTQLASRVVDKKNPQAWADQIRNYAAKPSKWPLDQTMARFKDQDAVLAALLQNKELGNHLCRIVSTDTFEEEEPEDKLSAEEIREADDMILMEKMRHQYPHMAQQAAIYSGERMMVDGTVFGPAASAPVGFPSTFLPAYPAPHLGNGLRPLTLPLFGSPAGPGQAVVLQANNSHPTAANLQPMRIPSLTTGSTGADMHGPAAQGEPTTNSKDLQARSLISSLEHLGAELRDRLTQRIIESDGRSVPSAQGMAQKLVSDIRTDIGQPSVPTLAQWTRLRDLVKSDAVFTAAIVSGRISAKTLATMNGPEQERLLAELHDPLTVQSAVHGGDSRDDKETSNATAATTVARERNKDPDVWPFRFPHFPCLYGYFE